MPIDAPKRDPKRNQFYHWIECEEHLLDGDFAGAEPHFRAKMSSDRIRAQVGHLAGTRWAGQRLDGETVAVFDEWGVGDAIHYLRFLGRIRALGGRVLLICRPILVPLLATTGLADEVVVHPVDVIHGKLTCHYDYYALLMDLPFLLNVSRDTIPYDIPYVFASPDRIANWRARMQDCDALRIGVVWSASERRGPSRSCAVECFGPLAEIPGVTLFSLQKGPNQEDVRRVPAIVPLSDRIAIDDYAETAAAMAAMDLVITVDTAAVHLAGALGRPVWQALIYAADWRWFRDELVSPWYPTMRLFRQERPGEWEPVFEQMKSLLADLPAGME